MSSFLNGWVTLGIPLGGREGGLPCPKCGWSIPDQILAASVESIGATQKGRLFENVFSNSRISMAVTMLALK